MQDRALGQVHDEDRSEELVEYCPIALLALPERVLGDLVTADVAKNDHPPDDLADVILHIVHLTIVILLTVGGAQNHQTVDLVRSVQHLEEGPVPSEQNGKVLADRTRGQSEHVCGHGIEVDQSSVLVQDQDGVRGDVHDHPSGHRHEA